MVRFLKKYWVELLVFGFIATILLVDLAPQLTWVNTDSDGAHYLLAAKHMWVAHGTSSPLFLLLGRLFLFLPFGSEPWRMGLISVLATIGCSVFIYLIVRHHLLGIKQSKARLYAIIAVLIYGGSALVVSQSTIIETYALATMLMVAAYYCSLKKKWIWVAVIIGFCWALHTLFALILWGVLFFKYRELRNLVLVFITLAFFAFYLYILIVVAVNNPPAMWGNTTFGGFFTNNWGVLMMLTGTLPIWELPKRILDTVGILGVSLGFGFIVLIFGFKKLWRKNKGLLWLTLIPIIYFLVNLSAQTYVYLLPAVAFGAVVVGWALSKMRRVLVYITLLVAIGLAAFNVGSFDVGNRLDPELSAMEFYNEELSKIPDGEIFLGGGWTWAMVYLYNEEEGRDIVPVCIDVLPSDKYLDILEADGIKLTRTDSTNLIDQQYAVALSIAESNPNVWIAQETVPETYGYEIVPAEGNEWLLSRWLGYEIEPEWKWKPSNPYHFITGALEVNEWKFILMSNWNVAFFIGLISIGLILNWFLIILPSKRREKKDREFVESLKDD